MPEEVSAQRQEVAMLKILLATCETALREFKAADNSIDTELLADLERIALRIRGELEALRN